MAPYSLLWLAWLLLTVSLVVSFWIWHLAWEDERRFEESKFNADIHDIEVHIRQRMRAYEQMLHGFAGLYAASHNVAREEWRAYASRLDIEKFYPGIQGVGFSSRLSPGERDRHIWQTRQEGYSNYTIFPKGIRDEYTAIIYMEPCSGRNLQALGFDMFSDPVRRAAMEQTRDTGVATISGKVTLLHKPSEAPWSGFLLYYPIYRNGWPITNVAQRRAALQGYVFSPFSMNALLTGILDREYPGLDIEIYDGTEVSPAALMYDSEQKHYRTPHLSSKSMLDIAGHQWLLKIDARPYSAGGIALYHPTIILGCGVGISLLLFALFRSMAISRTRAFALADRLSDDYREIAAHYRKLFDEGSDAIALADAETGELIDVNHAMELLSGWGKAEIVGKPQKMLHPPELESTSMTAGFVRCRSDMGGQQFETHLVTKEGVFRNVEIRASHLNLNGRRVLIGFFRDITVRKEYEQHLFTANELLERIFANIRTLIAYMDANFNFIRVNHAYAAADRLSPDYFLGKNHFDLYPNHENEQIFREVVSSGQPYVVFAKPFVYEHNHERGVSYWDWSVQPVKDEQGQVIGVVLSLLDRTEEKRIEEMLRLYGRVIDASDNSIVIVDAARSDIPVIYVNPAFTSITGYTPDEILGCNLDFLLGVDREQPEFESVRNAVREKCDGHAVLRNYKKDGRLFWSEWYISPVWSEEEVTHFIVMARDITLRIRSEQELEESRIQLRALTAHREQAREEERKHIAREIHDELGQILTGLQMDISVVVHKFGASSPPLHEHLQGTMILAKQALGVARNVASALRPAALDCGIVAALEWLVERFGLSSGISCELSIGDREIQLDENQALILFRIVQESLTNVVRHAQASSILISLRRDAHDYVLTVCDNGIGFDKSQVKVDSFGLLGVRERVLLLSGKIFINSSPGVGTEIVVCIPAGLNTNQRNK
ncbi:MAG TPA: hypothetical protein DFK12_07465 [Gallionellaceae bacterium]|nr:hypothetical protein [Gallionellaceae bacterium]